MHIPLTLDEIARFLEVPVTEVEMLWRRGLLRRSLSCTHRPVAGLNHSTIYDVLEYALSAGVLPVTLSKEVAALWISQLAEADEWGRFTDADFGTRVYLMLEMAVEDGLSAMTREPGKVAAVVVASQLGLLDLCGTEQVAC